MSLSSNRGDGIILRTEATSHGEFCFDNCHSISPFCVSSRNELSFRSCSLSRAPQPLCGIWTKVVRQALRVISSCTQWRVERVGFLCNLLVFVCSQVELRRRTPVEQVQLHQHTSVRGRGAGRTRGGDSHHDVSGRDLSTEKSITRGNKSKKRQITFVFVCAGVSIVFSLP